MMSYYNLIYMHIDSGEIDKAVFHNLTVSDPEGMKGMHPPTSGRSKWRSLS